ncbi:hypothetical protein CEP52_006298 [Fusarium oligoseptatum]|uniref:Uncharacterized protein n=1 Tax=Fusarium oligoseptatum TaxID=2604345 RepID=A0A428TTF0_9HYPO|nr:hypothetical protein CEP52_006298 [Fusarium oligoseptatum]
MSNKSSLVEENPTPASSLHSISSNLQSSHDTAVEDAWQEKVQREGIRLEDEPWYMTLPVAIKCRKGKAYYEKRAREDLDPREAQRAQSNVDWGNLIEEQIMYAGSGERKRIGPEAARVREEQFVSETEALSRRILHEADARNEDAQRKRRCKRKKRTQKTQASKSHPIDGIFR